MPLLARLAVRSGYPISTAGLAKQCRPAIVVPQRRGSVYLAVVGTAMLVSVIGFTAIHLSRIEVRAATRNNDITYARQIAQSGVEFATGAIDLDPSWRSNYTHGAESPRYPSGTDAVINFRLLDTTGDNDLGNDNTHPVEIQGIGRCGNAEVIYSVTYKPAVTSGDVIGPSDLFAYTGATSPTERVNDSNYIGQHFVPSLPAEATSWSVSQIQIYFQQHGATDATLVCNLYSSDGAGLPQTLLESVSFTENQLPTGADDWHEVNYTSVSGLTPGNGLSFTLEEYTGDGNAVEVPYGTGVSQSNAHLLRGGWGSWNSADTQSLKIRVRGYYTTSSGTGEFTVTPGSWQLIEAP